MRIQICDRLAILPIEVNLVRKPGLQLTNLNGAPIIVALPDELVQIVRQYPDLFPYVRDDLPVVGCGWSPPDDCSCLFGGSGFGHWLGCLKAAG